MIIQFSNNQKYNALNRKAFDISSSKYKNSYSGVSSGCDLIQFGSVERLLLKNGAKIDNSSYQSIQKSINELFNSGKDGFLAVVELARKVKAPSNQISEKSATAMKGKNLLKVFSDGSYGIKDDNVKNVIESSIRICANEISITEPVVKKIK